MAESAESEPKLNQFFLGVVDLFSIALPGAIIAFWMMNTYPDLAITSESHWDARTWAIFFVASYVAGHLISALAGIILDKVYDRTFKLWRRNRSEYIRLRLRAKMLVENKLGEFYSEEDNVLSWSEALVRLSSAMASAEIDHLEGHSKFFRSLTMVLALGWSVHFLSATPTSWPAWALLVASLGPLPLLYIGVLFKGSMSDEIREKKAKMLDELKKKRDESKRANDEEASDLQHNLEAESDLELEVKAEGQANYAVSKWLTRWTSFVAGAWVLLIAVPPFCMNPPHDRALGVACAVLGAFSVFRYMGVGSAERNSRIAI